MSLDPKKLESAKDWLAWLKKTAETEADRARVIGYEDCLREWQADLEARAARADEQVSALIRERENLISTKREQFTRLEKEIAALKAELARFEWRDISEAPHEVLLLVGWHDRTFDEWTCEVAMASWGKRSDNGHSNLSWHGLATHFIPLSVFLPTPPQAKEADHEA